MRFFKIRTSLLTLIFSVVTLSIHLGIGYLRPTVVSSGMLANIWQRSLSVYWPAIDLARVFDPIANGSPLMGLIVMIVAALFEWWIFFAVGIRLLRLYFRNPSIAKKTKIIIVSSVPVVVVFFFMTSPETLGTGKYDRFSFDVGIGSAHIAPPGWGTALHAAAQMGQAGIAELLLNNGSDVDAVSIDEWTPLHLAARRGQIEVSRVLIAHKANVNAKDDMGMTPLWWAAAKGNTGVVVLLLANGADVNAHNPLEGAIINNEYGIVPLLLSNGANATVEYENGDTMLYHVAIQDSPLLAESLLPYFKGTNAPRQLSKGFSEAVEFGNMDVAVPIAVAALRFESNSIYDAAFKGNLEDVRTQIELHPDLPNAKDFLGFSPLHRAAQGGGTAVVDLLLAKGADINSLDLNGNTPLHWAVFMGQSNMVKRLVDTITDLNVKGVGGKSPLHLAVQQGFISITELLLKAGANPNAKDDNGETPLSLLMRHNRGREIERRKEIGDLLREYGAKE